VKGNSVGNVVESIANGTFYVYMPLITSLLAFESLFVQSNKLDVHWTIICPFAMLFILYLHVTALFPLVCMFSLNRASTEKSFATSGYCKWLYGQHVTLKKSGLNNTDGNFFFADSNSKLKIENIKIN
jgi:hypothetical protein